MASREGSIASLFTATASAHDRGFDSFQCSDDKRFLDLHPYGPVLGSSTCNIKDLCTCNIEDMFDLNVEVEKLFQQTEVIFMSILHPGLLMYFVANEKNCSSSRNTQYCSVSQQEGEGGDFRTYYIGQLQQELCWLTVAVRMKYYLMVVFMRPFQIV